MTRPPWRADQPWNDLPLLPDPVELESRAVLKACIPARAALAELRQAAELIPDQAMLINTLPLLEAGASSEIENIVTTSDRLFRFQQSEARSDPATREALRYRHALLQGHRSLNERPLNTGTAEQLCSIIKGTEMRVRRVPGTRLTGTRGQVVYVPPEGEDRLRNLLADWERFLHAETDVDPLIRMAAAHYQFEAIHPFTDGNGRTGRVLNSLFLIQEGLLTLPILYLSRYILRNRADYYRLLLGVTKDGDWEAWLLFMLEGVRDTASWTTERIAAIRTLADHTAAHVRDRLPKIYSRELIDAIFEQPYCRIQTLVDRDIAGRQTASRYLRELARIGVLESQTTGREKLFTHPRLLQLLTGEEAEVAAYS